MCTAVQDSLSGLQSGRYRYSKHGNTTKRGLQRQRHSMKTHSSQRNWHGTLFLCTIHTDGSASIQDDSYACRSNLRSEARRAILLIWLCPFGMAVLAGQRHYRLTVALSLRDSPRIQRGTHKTTPKR
eukprot:3172430-Amphidinium_carterae.1